MSSEIKVAVRQVSGSTSEGQARGHKVICDRPQEKGGADDGAMGGELFLIGLGGCFMSNLLAAIKARELVIKDVAVSVAGYLDGTPPRFSRVHLEVSGTYPDRQEFEKLVVIAERGCIVANTIKESVQLAIVVA